MWITKGHTGNRGESYVYYFNCDYSFMCICTYMSNMHVCVYIKMDQVVFSIYAIIMHQSFLGK